MASDGFDEAEVSQLLVGTMLEGRKIETVEVSGGAALVIECGSSRAFEAWNVCRGLVEQTQRWPMFACHWAEESVVERLRLGVPLPLDQKAHGVKQISTVDEALTVIAEPELAWDAETQWGGASLELERLANVSGAAPELEEIKRTLGPETTLHDLKDWLFQWQLDHDRLVQTEADDSHMYEFEPSGSYGTAIALLPTANSWESLNHLDFYGHGVRPQRASSCSVLGVKGLVPKFGRTTRPCSSSLSNALQTQLKRRGRSPLNTSASLLARPFFRVSPRSIMRGR